MSPTRPCTMNTLRITLPLFFAGLVVAAGTPADASHEAATAHDAVRPPVESAYDCQAAQGAPAYRKPPPGAPIPLAAPGLAAPPVMRAQAAPAPATVKVMAEAL